MSRVSSSSPSPALLPTGLFLGGLALAALVAPTASAEVGIFRTDTREAAVEGESDGVAIGPLGTLELSPRVDRLAGLDVPFVFAADALADGGVVLGTGNEGQVIRVGADGTPEILATLAEPTVFAVLGRRDGSILAAGSPDGRVVRVAEGTLEEVFDPEGTYVWALAEDARGRLLVATGLPGRLLRVDGDGSEVTVETLYESPDGHVRSLWPREDGSVLVGTAGEGLIVEISADGTARTLYDAAEPEILAFAGTPGAGNVWAALLASEASLVDLGAKGGEGEGEAEATATPTVGSRGGGYQGPRSVIVSIDADGRVERRAELADETAHTILADGADLWVGTGQEGRLYRLRGDAEVDALVRETSMEERQIVALLPAGDATAHVVTTDAAAVYALRAARRDAGTYTSQVLDATELARFGTWRWRGDANGGRVEISLRTGMAAEPDATWTDWRSVGRLDAPGELAIGDIGRGRYAQWRARLVGGSGDGPRVASVELTYAQVNREPEITAFAALDPGKILVPQSFNPNSTTFEPWSPNRDGIFDSLREERDEKQLKELWKRGFRTLRWQAEDPNGDALVYHLEVRPESANGSGDSTEWLPVVEDLDQAWFSFDATVLPDGVYRFRLVAEESGRSDDDTRRAHRVSEPVVVDHTPPTLASSRRDGNALVVEVADAENPLRDAVVSVDAGKWHAVEAADGLVDARRETLRLTVPADARLVLLRVTDAALNVVTFDLSR